MRDCSCQWEQPVKDIHPLIKERQKLKLEQQCIEVLLANNKLRQDEVEKKIIFEGIV